MPQLFFSCVKIYVEIPLFFLFFAFMISDSVNSNLIIFRTCYVTLGYSKKECALLGSENSDNRTINLEKITEPYAAVINMMKSLIEGFCTAVVCLFAGPWMDHHGRKPLLIMPVIGYILYYVLNVVFAMFENLSPWYTLACLFPVYLTGGTPSYLTAVLCYISDSTDESNRGIKMVIFDATLSFGVFLGTLSSSYIFSVTNYAIVFLFAAGSCLLSLLLTIFFVPESLSNSEREGYLKEFFQFANVKEMVMITFKKRENYARYTVLCCVLLMIFSIVIFNGSSSVTFLFLRDKFHWPLQTYTLFAAYTSLIYAFASIGGVYIFHKMLKVPETILILVSLLSSLNGALLMGLAKSDWTIYAVPLAKLLDGIFGPMTRSLVSKVIPKEELGKLFALITSSQFLFGLMGSPLYVFIYNKTIATNPALFNFLSAGIYFLCVFIATTVIFARTIQNNINFNTMTNEENGNRQIVTDEEPLM